MSIKDLEELKENLLNQKSNLNNTIEEIKPAFWSEIEIRYGKLLLEEKNPILKQFLERESGIRKDILSKLERVEGIHISERKAELNQELFQIKEGLKYYAM